MKMLFAKPGEFEPCGMFNFKHLIIFLVTIFGVIFATKKTKIKDKEKVKKRIQKITIIMWILEMIKIVFTIMVGYGNNLNKVVPLYYCSLLLYAGILSSIGKGTLKRIGDVFLATGSIVAGVVFIILPTTSLTYYPMWHLVSIHSFIFHGIMLYLSLLINLTNYIKLEKKDIVYYASFLGIICIIAYIVNNIFGSNLMFISENYPGMPIEIIYNATGQFFTIIMTLAQMFIPFYIIYGMKRLNRSTSE